MKTSLPTKLFRILTVVLFFILIILLIFKLGGKLMIDSFVGVTPKTKTDNPYEQYRVSSSKSSNGEYRVKFTNINGVASPSAYDNKQTIYSMDIVISMRSPELAQKVQLNDAYTISIIRDVMSQFRQSDLSNDNGKEYFKARLKERIARDYGAGVEDIYFEKLIFQTLDNSITVN